MRLPTRRRRCALLLLLSWDAALEERRRRRERDREGAGDCCAVEAAAEAEEAAEEALGERWRCIEGERWHLGFLWLRSADVDAEAEAGGFGGVPVWLVREGW